MVQRFVLLAGLVLVLTSSAWAQRVEIAPQIGYTFSEGFTIDEVDFNGESFDKVNPTSGLSYGFTFDVYLNENIAVGFLFNQQSSNLEASGSTNVEFTDMKVRNYHGTFTYNFGDGDSTLRPFIMGGVGATSWSPGQVEGNSVDSATKFSSTWAGGVKVFSNRNVGLKVMGRWTPTYVKSDPAGVLCSPYWGPFFGGCYQVADTDYTNQFELSAAVAFRF